MEDFYQQTLWKNFAGAIDMLKAAITLCTDELWQTEGKFYYLAYHTTIFLDYYLTHPVKEFMPALPYTLVDPDHLPAEAVDDVIPGRYYSRAEMLAYLDTIREKCRQLILPASSDKFMQKWIEKAEIDLHGLCPSIVVDYTLLDILFYNFRHVQHHVGQLNLILRQKLNKAPGWIAQRD